jgi:hypothetical protein
MNIKKRKKYKKKLRYTKRSQRCLGGKLILCDEEMQEGIVITASNLRDFDYGETNTAGVSPYYFGLSKINWEGMITIKFYEFSFSQDNDAARIKRMRFLDHFMGNLKTKMKIPYNDFQWIACEEFGSTGVGHFHVLFSFDNLTQGMKNNINIHDFSENGNFLAELRESASFVSRKSHEMPKNPDIHWSQQWENDGLVRYFCKIENGREEKRYVLSKCHEKQGLIKVA